MARERLPLHRAPAMYRDLMGALRLGADALAGLRRERLRAIARHARERVPHYRRVFEQAGLTAIESEEDLRRLPVTSKDDLRRLPPEEVLGVPRAGLVPRTTSGSTGAPFTFHRSPEQQLYFLMTAYRSMLVNGLTWRDRLACIGQVFHVRGTLPQRLGVLPTRILSTLDPIDRQIRMLRTFRPTALMIYPSAARALAAAMLDRGVTAGGVRLAFTGSEMLDAGTAGLIERALGARPLSLYGCYEVARIGWQCEPGGPFHTADDILITEIVRDGRPVPDGETGELVVTHLTNREMPLIRYRVGDLARRVPRRCACGHAFGQIELAGGRVSEVLVLPDGTLRSPLRVASHVQGLPGVLHFQIRQERADAIAIRVVAGSGYRDDTPDRLRAGLEPLLPGARITVERVEEIPRTANGKLPYVVVAPELREAAARAVDGVR